MASHHFCHSLLFEANHSVQVTLKGMIARDDYQKVGIIGSHFRSCLHVKFPKALAHTAIHWGPCVCNQMSCLCKHQITSHLLSTFYAPGFVGDAGDTVIDEAHFLPLRSS